MTNARTDHWENVYTTKADDSVSWFEQSPLCYPFSLLNAVSRLEPRSTHFAEMV